MTTAGHLSFAPNHTTRPEDMDLMHPLIIAEASQERNPPCSPPEALCKTELLLTSPCKNRKCQPLGVTVGCSSNSQQLLQKNGFKKQLEV